MQRETRSMSRSNSISRGKRSLNAGGGGGDEEQPERKRPALANVIVEALKMDNLQRLCSSLEPILRKVVSEEVERALARLVPSRIIASSSPRQIQGSNGRNMQLQFKSKLSLPLFTGGKVEGENNAAIHIVILDSNTGLVVTSGPESSVKLDVVVLEGDFNKEEDEGWSEEEFESHVVKEREGKRPLLTGDLQVTLKQGVGTLGDFTFTDNSSWIRSRKFRLGLKVASGYYEGVRIREAKTEAFNVKDHRGELYKKHYPPALTDDVWRLEKIGKDGSFHKRLNNSGIYSVEDFLRIAVKDSQGLRTILGSGMSNKMWDTLMEHSKTCVLSGTVYVYYSDDTKKVGVVFNNIYELGGLIAEDQYLSVDCLTDYQKEYVDTLVKKAYENWNETIEYDGKTFLSSKRTRKIRSFQNEFRFNNFDFPNITDNQMAPPPLPAPIPDERRFVGHAVVLGLNDNIQHQIISSNSQNQFDNTTYTQHDLMNAKTDPQPQLSSSSEFQSINPYDDWSQNPFSEDEIRVRSHELLETDDMQQLLRLFSTGGPPHEENYSYSTYIPTPSSYNNNSVGRPRSGRAFVGWLKLKAALRWGIFIRKKAAQRRAQLVELDD